MNISNLTELTHDQVMAVSANHHFILLAPRFRNRTALLAWFTQQPLETLLCAFTEHTASLADFVWYWIESIRESDTAFRTNALQALALKMDHPAK